MALKDPMDEKPLSYDVLAEVLQEYGPGKTSAHGSLQTRLPRPTTFLYDTTASSLKRFRAAFRSPEYRYPAAIAVLSEQLKSKFKGCENWEKEDTILAQFAIDLALECVSVKFRYLCKFAANNLLGDSFTQARVWY
jgi:hypothetical protein